MKVTYNWLKDFVEIKVTPEALAEKLTMAGLEVTAREEKDGDCVLEVEVTANRPDCLSVIGIAREVAAITGRRLKLDARCSMLDARKIKNLGSRIQDPELEIQIEDKKDCPLYTAKILEGIKVSPSPDWLKKRLELVGCRSVNNIVDITNYILFEWGQPLHAFDLDKLDSSRIFVRRAKNTEKITTIDGEEKILNPNILVIAGEIMPIAVAGVIGGKDTEVNEHTTRILLESAVFNPILVRQSRRDVGIQTESSYRFERGVDVNNVDFTSWQAVRLMQDIAGARFSCGRNRGLVKARKESVNLDIAALKETLGVSIPAARAKMILNNLGCKVRPNKNNRFSVKIPSFRPDIQSEIDLIEEVGRIFGYDAIPKTLPAVIPQINYEQATGMVAAIKNILVASGSNEVITLSLIGRPWLKDEDHAAQILNPLTRDQAILRPSLIPSLLNCVSLNLNQKQNYVNIFEIAKVFIVNPDSGVEEKLALGIALCGVKSWLSGQGAIKEEMGALHLKGILEVVFQRLGAKDYNFIARDNFNAEVNVGAEKIGSISRIGTKDLEEFDIKNKQVLVAQLFLDKLRAYTNLKKYFRALPLYPAILRDISLVLKENISVADILTAIKNNSGTLLQEARVVDYYIGKQIPSGFKGITISCAYRSDERTLTEAEINPLHSVICRMLTDKFGAQIR